MMDMNTIIKPPWLNPMSQAVCPVFSLSSPWVMASSRVMGASSSAWVNFKWVVGCGFLKPGVGHDGLIYGHGF